MRVVIDTEREQIIVPDTFYRTIDKKNEVLEKAGADIKIDYVDYVKNAFENAVQKPWIRKSDLPKKPAKSKDNKNN